MDDPVGYLYRTAMNLFRKRYRRAMLAIRRIHRTRVLAGRLRRCRRSRNRTAGAIDATAASARCPRADGDARVQPREAGRALGVQASTVRSLSHQGRESFRRAMEVDDA